MALEHLYILGGGLSGLSTAHHSDGQSTIYEKKDSVGGTASSMTWRGFTFDYGPHVSFTNDKYVKELLAKSIDNEFWTKEVSNSNYYQGKWVRHPAICNLCDFPKEVNRDALVSFLESKEISNPEIQNYRDWCEIGQGKFFAENFTHTYTRKFWTVEPEEMTHQWAGERVARPNLRRVVDGSLGLQKDAGYYYTEFRYPKHGGYGAYTSFWKESQDKINLKLNHTVTKIDLEKRTLSFVEQEDVDFGDTLISSLPLPEFVKLVVDVPEIVKDATEKLKCTSIALINIALSDPSKLPYHWCYVYDEDVITPRFTIYSNLSEFNAPQGCTSLQAEVPYSNSRPLPLGDLVARVIDDLDRCQIIDKQSVIHAWQVDIKYGYVIFDHNRESAIKVIHDWMDQNGVLPIGRFGLWQYLWSDQAIKSGKLVASRFV